jgi:hypothetical protein
LTLELIFAYLVKHPVDLDKILINKKFCLTCTGNSFLCSRFKPQLQI